MPYDKLVDSAKLDAAMTATADAIRAKTENTAKISWDETSGFASAIEAVSSGVKVATGTFTANESNGRLDTYPLTISGLGFTPSRVIIWLFDSSHANSWDEIICLDWDGTSTHVTYVYNNGAWCEECSEYVGLFMFSETDTMQAGNTISMSVGDGWFTLSSDKGGLNAADVFYVGLSAGATYGYIAIA